MSLRARIVLVFAAALLLLMGIIGLPAALIVSLIDQQYRAVLREKHDAAWLRSIEVASIPLVRQARLVVNDPGIKEARERADAASASARLVELMKDGDKIVAALRIDLVGKDAQLVASTEGLRAETPLADAANVLSEMTERPTGAIAGMAKHPSGALVAVASLPFPGGGFVTVAGPITDAVTRFGDVLAADIFVTDNKSKLVASTKPALWPRIGALAVKLDSIHDYSADDRHFRVVPTAIRNDTANVTGPVIGTVYVVSDVTFEVERRALVLWVTGAVTLLALAVILTWLYSYLQSAFTPLTGVTETVRALARGDTSVRADVPERTDEIGRIAEAVEVFRRNALELERLSFRDRVQRAQEESLIRHEMKRLASTLEPAARQEMVADLERIEQTAHGTAMKPAETASVLSIAFRLMAERVVDQHGKLSNLLEERTRDLEIVRQALAERSQLNRLREEMELAHNLQLSSLPATFPAFPHRHDFDLHATMRPATEVGGDFYDFALIDENHLGLFIGDASGKGVAAAMFIAMGRSLIRSAATRGGSPAECLTMANNALAVENNTMMFATAFAGILHLPSGRIRYASAGHNPPYIRRADGTIETLNQCEGVPLGIAEDLPYTEGSIGMGPDDMLVMFTDGVTEATSSANECFLENRLIDSITAGAGLKPADLLSRVITDIDAFVGAAPQFDDITLLGVRFIGAGATASSRAPVSSS